MELPSTEVVATINYLLPGFITAWIFYGFTAYRPKNQIERIIEAVIYSTLIQIIIVPIRISLLWIGSVGFAVGVWDHESSMLVSFFVALILGVTTVIIANSSKFHDKVPGWFSRKTSYPSEWYSAFDRAARESEIDSSKGYISLSLKNGKRVFGWNTEWPNYPDEGHFVIHYPSWVDEENKYEDIRDAIKIVIPVTDVCMVTFIEKKSESELKNPVSLIKNDYSDDGKLLPDTTNREHKDSGLVENRFNEPLNNP